MSFQRVPIGQLREVASREMCRPSCNEVRCLVVRLAREVLARREEEESP